MDNSQTSTKSNSVYSCFQLFEQAKMLIVSECQSESQINAVHSMFSSFNDQIQHFWQESIDASDSAELARSASSTDMEEIDPISKLEMSVLKDRGETSANNATLTSPRADFRRNREYLHSNDVNVLIVDDCPLTSMLLIKQLKKFSYNAVAVNSGADALAMLFKDPEKFDLVLCDVTMPGLGGYEVLKAILASPSLRDLPVVHVSCADDAEDAQKLVEAGARDYFTKPIGDVVIAQLIVKIKRWRDQSCSMQAAQLNTFYTISQELFLQVKIVLAKVDNKQLADNGLEGEVSDKTQVCKPEDNGKPIYLNQFRVVAALSQGASRPMLELLGVTDRTAEAGTFDILPYIHQLDMPGLQDYILSEMVSPQKVGTHEKLLWRWVHSSGEVVPVTGSWVGNGSNIMIIESTSLLPTLKLRHEQRKRVEAEKKLKNLEQDKRCTEQLREQEMRTNQLAKKEMETIVLNLSNFSRMLTANSSVLTWRINANTGEIDFVTDEACTRILGYYSREINGKSSFDMIHKDDLENHKYTLAEINRTSRIRRYHKDGSIRWLESRSFFRWYNSDCLIVLTEYDITNFMQ